MRLSPSYSSLDIVRILFSTAQDLGAPGIDDIYGHGLVRLDRALAVPAIDPAAASNTTTLVSGESRYWSAPVTVQGTLTIEGAGREQGTGSELLVSGRAAVRGGIQASNVHIEVDGTLTTPNLAIAPSASLSGEGDIFGDVMVRGLFSPGSGDAGDLVVHGNLRLTSEAQFRTVINASDVAEAGLYYSTAVVTGPGHVFTAAG